MSVRPANTASSPNEVPEDTECSRKDLPRPHYGHAPVSCSGEHDGSSAAGWQLHNYHIRRRRHALACLAVMGVFTMTDNGNKGYAKLDHSSQVFARVEEHRQTRA